MVESIGLEIAMVESIGLKIGMEASISLDTAMVAFISLDMVARVEFTDQVKVNLQEVEVENKFINFEAVNILEVQAEDTQTEAVEDRQVEVRIEEDLVKGLNK